MSNALRQLADAGRLDVAAQAAFDADLWSVQKQIFRAISKPRARVAVPSCNSSGKTALAGLLAPTFYACYPDAKVVTTSAREDQLRDNLWGEIRRWHGQRQFDFPGHVPPAGMRVQEGNRLMTGLSPAKPEGVKGYHSPHVLVVIDEAAALDEMMAGAINTLTASGDARVLAIFNPSDSNTWAAEICESSAWEVIPIPAWSTPLLARLSNEEINEKWGIEHLPPTRTPIAEPIPRGAELISPFYLDELKASSKGPGTYDWETSVEARFWAAGLDVIVSRAYYDASRDWTPAGDQIVFGIDLAAYGDSESVVAIRRGNKLIELIAHDGYRIDQFWKQIVSPLVATYEPRYVIWDADGPGAGSFTDAYAVCGSRALPFRGSQPVPYNYLNMRSMHYWGLHERFDFEDIVIGIDDATLRRQLTAITYQRRNGKVVVEQKQDLRKRGVRSIDRADAVMYAFSSDPPADRRETRISSHDLADRDASSDLMWERWNRNLEERNSSPRRPVRLR